MKRKIVIWLFLFLILLPSLLFAQGTYRDTNRFTSGFQRVLLAPFQIPVQTIRGMMSGSPVTGALGGILVGTFRTVSDLVGGIFDMAASAAPYAKYAALAL